MSIVKRGLRILKEEGPQRFSYLVLRRFFSISKSKSYKRWIKNMESGMGKQKLLGDYQPMISIIIPVYNVIEKQLKECIESVLAQTYENWQLCIVDDCSTMSSVKQVLSEYEINSKIKVKYRKENGHISRATNDGLAMADGEFIAFLDCDDLLASNALYEVIKLLNYNKTYDYIYSDEDLITEDGKKRYSPFFKPDWSPDTLMSMMYTGHLSVYRKSIVDEIGGLRIGYEGAQDYDLALRFTEKTQNIGHIDKVLYHWRARAESTADDPKVKMYAYTSAKKAKEDAIQRRNLTATLEYIPNIYQWRVNYYNSEKPLVSILIPSKNNYKCLRRCIESLVTITEYKNYEIIVIDNGSDSENRFKYEELSKKYQFRYYYKEMEFNFSRMCNMGASKANGEFLLFLNDDIEIKESVWLERMLGHASLEHIGAVGAKLLYPNTIKIQHAGVINYTIGPGHPLLGMRDDLHYYYCRNVVEYNYIAVTGACLLIEKNKFLAIDGFDESFPIAYNDIDLCFRLIEKGYFNLLRNDAILYHHESMSRGLDSKDDIKRQRLNKEREKLYEKHPRFIGEDPFYSKNLSQDRGNYSINVDRKE